MSQPLPVGGFDWVEPSEEQCIIDHPVDSPYGYIIEATLEYPESLHYSHNAYPLAPERMVVPNEWMSEYQRGLLGGNHTEVEKLVPSLRTKEP